MEKLVFFRQLLASPTTIGAVIPSSKYAARKMVEDIDFAETRYIVEYGPGTGVFTEELLKNRNPDTLILSIEYNEKLCALLQKKYGHESHLHVIHDSAENVDLYLEQYNIPEIDVIVSALPYLSLPESVSEQILSKSSRLLRSDGRFITIQYSKLRMSFINRYFGRIDVKRELRNIPPAYIFSCTEAHLPPALDHHDRNEENE